MKQKVLCVLLALALLLTACGAPAPSEPEVPEAPAPVETAAPEPEPESEPEPEPEPEAPEAPAPIETAAPEPEPEPEPVSGLVGIAMPTKDLWDWKLKGILLKEQLDTLGYETDLEFAQEDISMQIEQIDAMIENGARLLIIGAIDGEALGAVLEKARQADIQIIAYDRLIMCSDAVGYFCTYNNEAIGRSFVQYIADALDLAHADGKTYNIEFFFGDPGDSNAGVFYGPGFDLFDACFDSGTLNTPSGLTLRMDCTIEQWDTDKARERMEKILDEYYSDGKNLDAVYCANDSVALGVEQALETSYYGSTYPIITGQDCDLENVKNILAGKQSMSAFNLTDDLAAAAVEMADAIMQGKEPPVNDTKTYDNEYGIIPSYLIGPRVVTADNYREILIDTGYYTEEDLAS